MASFHESFDAETPPLPSERSTGLVFAGAFIIGAILVRNSTIAVLPWALAAASVGFAAVAVAVPRRLARLNVAWFKLALALNRIVSPVVMGVLFLVAIVPFGLAMQLKRDPLRKRPAQGSTTHWIACEAASIPSSMKNQF